MYLFIDTETTGLSHHNDHIVQLAWMLTDEVGNIKAEECHVIRPDGYSIPPMAARIHGITTAKACEIGQPLGVVLQRMSDAATRATIVVAHNLSFDFGILQHDYKIACLPFPLHGKTQICTMRLSATWCRLPKLNGATGFKYPKLDELYYRLFGEGFDGAHDALADTHACRRCYFELVRLGVITPLGNPAEKSVQQGVERKSVSKNTVDSHSTRIILCPKCSQKLRIPANKNLIITCTSCYNKFKSDLTGNYTPIPRPPTPILAQHQAADPKDASAQFNLGLKYVNGDGVSQDYVQAAHWYRKAADQGHAGAQNNLGVLYKNGQGVAQDNVKAMVWYHKAAEQGHANAQYNLGNIYYGGQGMPQQTLQFLLNTIGAAQHDSEVPRDYDEAAKWYRKAAEQGHADAQYSLGFMYYHALYNDESLWRNVVKGMMWLFIAKASGSTSADKSLQQITSPLNFFHGPAKRRIAEAQKLAREWMAVHPQKS